MSDNEIDSMGAKSQKEKRGMFSKMRSWFSRKPKDRDEKQRRVSEPSTPTKQDDQDDDVEFESTTLTSTTLTTTLGHQGHQLPVTEKIEPRDGPIPAPHPLTQHPRNSGQINLQDELRLTLSNRRNNDQGHNWTPEERGTQVITRKPKPKLDHSDAESINSQPKGPMSPRQVSGDISSKLTSTTSKPMFAKGNEIIALFNTKKEKKSTSNLASSGTSAAPVSSFVSFSGATPRPDESVLDAVRRITEKINQKQCYTDSEDDEPIDYKDQHSLQQKLARRDTIARQREMEEMRLQAKNNESIEQKHNIKLQLSRRLSQRPSATEIKDRGILKAKSTQEQREEKEKIKKELSRRLSQRPSVSTLMKKRIIKFEEYVDVYEIQYVDRRADKPWTRLTANEKASIRKELNEYKANEMEVHEQSQFYTRFHRE